MPTHDEEFQSPAVPGGKADLLTEGTCQMPTTAVQAPLIVPPAQLFDVNLRLSILARGVSGCVTPICGLSLGVIWPSGRHCRERSRSRNARGPGASVACSRASNPGSRSEAMPGSPVAALSLLNDLLKTPVRFVFISRALEGSLVCDMVPSSAIRAVGTSSRSLTENAVKRVGEHSTISDVPLRPTGANDGPQGSRLGSGHDCPDRVRVTTISSWPETNQSRRCFTSTRWWRQSKLSMAAKSRQLAHSLMVV